MKKGRPSLAERRRHDGPKIMGWTERASIYQEIETHRRRPLVVYITSKRVGVYGSMATDALPFLIDQLDALPTGTKAIDLMIVSFGGDPMVAWRIMSLIRQRVQKVSVLIPQSAYSAATLLAFGANQIVMHPNGHLGPVDMQIVTSGGSGAPKEFSTEDITAFIEFVRDNVKISAQEQLRILFERTCFEVGSLGIGFTARSSKLAIDLGERLLALHLPDDDGGAKRKRIVQDMCKKFQSHAYPINREEALDIGLAVNRRRDKKLEDLMWKAWLDIEAELEERIPFDPIVELMKSPEAGKLAAAVPQADFPVSASVSFGAADLKGAHTVSVDPVPFKLIIALTESCRMSNRCLQAGKILSCRAQDLSIQYNLVTESRTWETNRK
ncbi:MAG TPA: hypothetical protein VHC86_07910 [Opitutaceae bacterium]|nr:hypothetical protein [Opitutaceae bacterium]